MVLFRNETVLKCCCCKQLKKNKKTIQSDLESKVILFKKNKKKFKGTAHASTV